jgi:hypothetical protein
MSIYCGEIGGEKSHNIACVSLIQKKPHLKRNKEPTYLLERLLKKI